MRPDDPQLAVRRPVAPGPRPPRRARGAFDRGVRRRLSTLVRSYPRQYWLMVVGMFISNAGGSLVWPYILIFASARLGLPLAAVGSLITIQAVSGMLASFVAGTLADRFGRKLVMTFSLASNGLIYLALVGAHSYPQFAILLALLGMSNPLYQVGADAMLADMIPSEQRTQAFAINRMSSNAGFALGPAVGGFLAATSYSLAFYGATTGFLTYATLLFLLARETLPGRRPRGPATSALPIGSVDVTPIDATPIDTAPIDAAPIVAAPIPPTRIAAVARGYGVVIRDRRFLSFAGLLSLGLIAPTTVWILLAVYTKTNFGMPEYLFGWIPTVNAVMCVVVQYPVTVVTRRFSPLPVLTVGMLIYALGAGSVALMSSFPGFVASMVVLTIGELVVVPVASKYVADLAPADLRGRYMSVYWLSWAASRGVAPLVGGFLNDRIAPIAIWYGALLIGLASAAGLGWLATRSRGGRSAALVESRPA